MAHPIAIQPDAITVIVRDRDGNYHVTSRTPLNKRTARSPSRNPGRACARVRQHKSSSGPWVISGLDVFGQGRVGGRPWFSVFFCLAWR
jgi:hypothetical protein